MLSFRETRARESLSLSQAIGSRNNMLLRSDGCFPSPALPPRRKGHDMRCARPWAVLGAQLLHCGAALTRVRVYSTIRPKQGEANRSTRGPGVCETFQRVSQRGYTSPFVLQGPNLGTADACNRQCLTALLFRVPVKVPKTKSLKPGPAAARP